MPETKNIWQNFQVKSAKFVCVFIWQFVKTNQCNTEPNDREGSVQHGDAAHAQCQWWDCTRDTCVHFMSSLQRKH